ncbi:MAG: deoxyhypusine synthase family protein [Nitrososphaerota archaeon]
MKVMSGENPNTTDEFLSKPLSSIEVKERKISDLLSAMSLTGFQGRKLGEAVDAWVNALQDEDVVIMMGYAGSLSTTGQWRIIKWLIENRYIDVLISTGANITEDIIEAMGHKYWRGSPYVDDDVLRKRGIYRFYDVYVKESDYISMEKMLADFMLTLSDKRVLTSPELLYLLGKWLDKRGVNGIVTTASRNNVPIFCPAIVDSGFGVAYIYNRYRNKEFSLLVDQFKDYELLVRIKSSVKDSAVIFIGGGVPKDFIQLSAVAVDLLLSGNYYQSRPHKYAIQITVDSPHWGGLSGATLEEGKSWGKESKEGMNVQCFCDATIALPLIAHSLLERVKYPRKGPDLSWIFSSVTQ